MSLCGYVHLSIGAQRLNLPEAGVPRWWLMWVLGVDLRSSTRAGPVLPAEPSHQP